MINEKEELQNRLKAIERMEENDKEQKRKWDNYEKFYKRIDDWVIGKAHADIGVHNINRQWRKSVQTIGQTISIHGNIGDSYNPEAQVTSSTNTYFHNLWSDNQRYQFQQKLNEVALKEIKKIVNSLPQILDFIGYQSTEYLIKAIYPEDKIDEIKFEVWNENVSYVRSDRINIHFNGFVWLADDIPSVGLQLDEWGHYYCMIDKPVIGYLGYTIVGDEYYFNNFSMICRMGDNLWTMY